MSQLIGKRWNGKHYDRTFKPLHKNRGMPKHIKKTSWCDAWVGKEVICILTKDHKGAHVPHP